jgi:uncharacterized damage-inducible protein DinB
MAPDRRGNDMDITDLKTLVDYHYWARDRMLEAVARLDAGAFGRDLGSSFRSIRDTVSHIYFSEWAWHSRWRGHSPSAPPRDPFDDVGELRAAWAELETNVRAFVEEGGPAGVDRVFEYRLFSGAAAASPFWQMLQHVVNHASYHRGQVTTMLRQVGAEPPKGMDLIAFHRRGGR